MLIVFFFFTNLIITLIAIVVLKRMSYGLNLLDYPREHKVHQVPTPLVGGVAIFMSTTYTWMMLQSIDGGKQLATLGIFAGMMIIFLEGLRDDISNTRAKHRFLFHVAVITILSVLSGFGLKDLGEMFSNTVLYTGMWLVPLTVFAAAGGVNSYNMIDGIDGLAGSLALVSIIGMLVLTIDSTSIAESSCLAGLAGAITGFLVFNLRTPWQSRAKVFLGDSGSLLIGLLVVWLLVDLTQGEHRVMSPVMALWFFIVPLFDAVGKILRRLFIEKQSPLIADQKHIHHLLVRMGFTVPQAVGILTGVQTVSVLTAIIMHSVRVPEYYMFYAFLALFALYFYGIASYWRAGRNAESMGAIE